MPTAARHPLTYLAPKAAVNHCDFNASEADTRCDGNKFNKRVIKTFQRMSLTLMRGNAALMMSRRPDSDLAAPEIDGIQ